MGAFQSSQGVWHDSWVFRVGTEPSSFCFQQFRFCCMFAGQLLRSLSVSLLFLVLCLWPECMTLVTEIYILKDIQITMCTNVGARPTFHNDLGAMCISETVYSVEYAGCSDNNKATFMHDKHPSLSCGEVTFY